MADINPRMAVAYHFFNDYDTQPIVLEDIRNMYDGPLSLAVDYMVWNVTKEKITTRMAAIDEDIWPQPSVFGNKPANPNDRIGFSKYIWDGRVNYSDVLTKIYDDINEEYGTSVEVPKE
jgi:ribonuclease Z